MNILFPQFLLGIVFLTIIFSHVTKKNAAVVSAYAMQSLAVVGLLLNSFFETGAWSLLLIILLTFCVKVVLAPLFFFRLIKQTALRFLVGTYLNIPATLIILVVVTAVA